LRQNIFRQHGDTISLLILLSATPANNDPVDTMQLYNMLQTKNTIEGRSNYVKEPIKPDDPNFYVYNKDAFYKDFDETKFSIEYANRLTDQVSKDYGDL